MSSVARDSAWRLLGWRRWEPSGPLCLVVHDLAAASPTPADGTILAPSRPVARTGRSTRSRPWDAPSVQRGLTSTASGTQAAYVPTSCRPLRDAQDSRLATIRRRSVCSERTATTWARPGRCESYAHVESDEVASHRNAHPARRRLHELRAERESRRSQPACSPCGWSMSRPRPVPRVVPAMHSYVNSLTFPIPGRGRGRGSARQPRRRDPGERDVGARWARANIVDNVFVGPKDGARLWPPPQAFFGGGNIDQNTKSKPEDHLPAPLPVPGPSAAFSRADARGAGASPRDAIDSCYLDVAAASFLKVRAAPCTMSAP